MYQRPISTIESGSPGGNYNALGPVTRTGDRAYGRYGMMGKNIPQWSMAALGQSLTPDQFLANKNAQDAIFNHRFGQYVNKYGPGGAARAWFAGEGGMNDMGRRDQLGTTVANYQNKFLRGLQGGQGGQGGQSPVQLASLGGVPTADTPTPMGGAGPAPDSPPAEAGPVVAQAQGQTPFAPGLRVGPGPGFGPAPAAPAAPVVQPAPPLPTPNSTIQAAPRPGEMTAQPKFPTLEPKTLDELKLERALVNPRYGNDPQYKQHVESLLAPYKAEREAKDAFKKIEYQKQLDRWNAQQGETFKENSPTALIEREIKTLEADLKRTTNPIEKQAKQVELEQKLATLEKTRKEIAQKKTMQVGDLILEQQDDGTWIDKTPGVVRENIKLTQEQSDTLKFYERSRTAGRIVGDGAVLANLKDSLVGRVPIGGNFYLTPEYRIANAAAEDWIQATVRDISGATIRDEEIAQAKRTYFPVPGDDAEAIALKAKRRETAEQTLLHSLGNARFLADRFDQDFRLIPTRTEEKMPDGRVRTDPDTGKQEVLITKPNGNRRWVPK